MSNSLMSTYAPLPVTFESGSGVYLKDTDGKEYLDALAGIAVCSLGHCHPEVTKAICEQASSLVHTSNVYHIQHQEDLSNKLCALADMDKVFFSNSGAEANEAAIKLARLYGRKQGIETPNIIVMNGSFHGRTLATLSATGSRKVQAGFAPLVSGFVRVEYNDIEAINTVAKHNKDIVAVLVEPVQGEGGVNIPDSDYLDNIRKICDENNWLMMLDEIQTGTGRTGKWFAHQHNDNAKPDVMTLAKALGNGVPIGACLAAGKAADVLSPGTHGSTFGGNPLATRAALAVLNVLETSDHIENATTIGNYLVEQFKNELNGVDGIEDIRNLGLMVGIELNKECVELVKQALEKQLLINVTAGNTIRLLPPMILTKEQADEIVNTLSPLIKAFV